MVTPLRRRTFLSGVAVAGGLSVTDAVTNTAAQTACTPGHDDGDPPCEQVDDDASVLTGFEAAGTPLAVTFDYPCGWRTSTSQFQDRSQANVTRDDFEAYADVQVRTYYDPVGEGFVDAKRNSGDYVDVEFEVAGETRTGIVSSRETAQFGTVGHATVPFGDALVHVELISTLKGTECTQPRPDYDLVRGMLRSLEPNRKSTFPDESGHVEEYGVARIDPQRIAFDEANQRVEVPPMANVSLPGITNLAAGSNLTVQVNSKAGEESAFFDLQSGIEPRAAADSDWQVWAVTTSAFVDAQVGTEFEIKIRSEGSEGNINPGKYIEGVVVDAPTVDTFEFTDKTSNGNVVTVDRVETSQGGVIVLEDADGTALGRSGQLAGDQIHDNVPVSLDEALEAGSHEITGTVFLPNGTPYPENEVRTATITVGDGQDLPALFEVRDLQPDSPTLDAPGETLTVTATVENTGDREGTSNVALSLAGSVQSTRSVTLSGGATREVSFQLDTSGLQVGETVAFRISTADGSTSGTVSVDSATASQTGTDSTADAGDGASSGQEGTDGGGPGFGVGAAVLAVLGAMGLASRYSRQD